MEMKGPVLATVKHVMDAGSVYVCLCSSECSLFLLLFVVFPL